MDSERWDERLERWIAVLVGAAIGLAVLAFGGVRIGEFLWIEGLMALALLLWGVRIWTVRDHRLLWPPVCWGVLGFGLWAVWRTAVADVAYVAWGEGMRIATYTALYFVAVNNLNRQSVAQGLAWFLAGLATLLCFYGAWQFATGANAVWGFERSADYVRRASGTYMNPNHFAGLLALLLPVAIGTVIAGRMKPVGRVLLGYAALAMMAGLALSLSRGGWAAASVGVGLVLLALSRHRDYRRAAVVSVAVIVVGIGAVAMRSHWIQGRVAQSQDLEPTARNSRPHIWRAAVGMWQDHPWFGVGPAHFSERFKAYRTRWVHGEPERAHNDYLDALADWGVLGVTVLAVPLVLLGYGVVRTLRQVRRDPGDLEVKRSGRYAFVLGASGGLAALAAHSLADFNWHIPANAMVAVLWMGLLTGYFRYATDDWWVSSRWPWRWAVSLGLILPLTGLLGWDLVQRGRETRHLERAQRAIPASDGQVADLEAAWRIDSRNAWTAYRLAEAYRLRSFTGEGEFRQWGQRALEWFEVAARLNPFEPVFRHRAGMCLDWLGEPDRAAGYYQAARELDPEGRITSFYMGWHEMQKGNLAEARRWFTLSTEQGWPPYEPAMDYLRVLDEREAVLMRRGMEPGAGR
ncbi:MAG: O-antigen ligase family protein [Verrucomicrobiae bacterium]|nr:O-antigen ligase family protein [Verrucomicrobiae bacterium]